MLHKAFDKSAAMDHDFPLVNRCESMALGCRLRRLSMQLLNTVTFSLLLMCFSMKRRQAWSAAAYHRLWKVGSWVNSMQMTPMMAMNSVSVTCFVPPSKVYTACRNMYNVAVIQRHGCCQVHANVKCNARCTTCI